MDANRFDRLAKAFAGRLTRRGALAAGGGGLAAALLGARGPRRAPAAQDATPGATPGVTPAASPAASPAAEVQDLFVQVFEAGTWAPVPGEPGTYTLTLTGHAAQTIQFADRPERIVGTVPTRRLLATLGFGSEDPPNAALVAQTADGEEEVLVVELFDPVYAEAFGADGGVTVAYRARVLADYRGEGLASLAARQGDAQLPEAFGPASLFIDGCSDRSVRCCTNEHWYTYCSTEHGRFGPMGYCYPLGKTCCAPCSDRDHNNWARKCNETFSSCGGNCFVLSTHGADLVGCW